MNNSPLFLCFQLNRWTFSFALFLSSVSWIANAQVNGSELTRAEKIYGLSLVWMEVHRNFPLRERLKNLDEEYKNSLEAVGNAPDLKSYYRELQIFVAKLHDGHTFIRLPKGMYVTKSRLPIGVTRYGADAVVTWGRDDLISSIPLGSVITEIDGHQYQDALAAGRETAVASTAHVREDKAYFLALEGDKGSTVELKFVTPDNEIRTMNLVRGAPWPQNSKIVELEENPTEVISFKWLTPNEVVYIAINSFADNSVYENFLKLIPTLKSAKYIVLDFRKNDGGDDAVGFNILSHFLSSPAMDNRSTKFVYDPTERSAGRGVIIEGTISQENLGFKSALIPSDTINPSKKEDHLDGRLIVLTGHATLSAAEDFLVAASSMKHVRIGEITAGSTGQPVVIKLPGGGAAYILSKKDTYPSGEEFVGKGIAPNIEIAPTLDDVRKKRDVVIEKTLQLISQGKI